MAKPLSLVEQLKQTPFVPDRRIALVVGISKYDKLEKIETDRFNPGTMNDLPQNKNECDDFLDCLRKFGFDNEDDIYDLSDNATRKQINEKLTSIRNKLKDGKNASPMVNYHVVCFFSCHGILKDG